MAAENSRMSGPFLKPIRLRRGIVILALWCSRHWNLCWPKFLGHMPVWNKRSEILKWMCHIKEVWPILIKGFLHRGWTLQWKLATILALHLKTNDPTQHTSLKPRKGEAKPLRFLGVVLSRESPRLRAQCRPASKRPAALSFSSPAYSASSGHSVCV